MKHRLLVLLLALCATFLVLRLQRGERHVLRTDCFRSERSRQRERDIVLRRTGGKTALSESSASAETSSEAEEKTATLLHRHGRTIQGILRHVQRRADAALSGFPRSAS